MTRNEAKWLAATAEAANYLDGNNILELAERWARLIEAELAAGRQLRDVAATTLDLADVDGIVGFAYNADIQAAELLENCWLYGPELMLWLNRRHGRNAA